MEFFSHFYDYLYLVKNLKRQASIVKLHAVHKKDFLFDNSTGLNPDIFGYSLALSLPTLVEFCYDYRVWSYPETVLENEFMQALETSQQVKQVYHKYTVYVSQFIFDQM